MNVTQAIKQRVEAKLREGIALAEAKYNQKFTMPTILYTKGGATAGIADYHKWLVNFNPDLLVQNLDDFIARTVPHELAHLITDRVYPEAHEGGITFTRYGRMRRQKREVHGRHWQSVMRVLGVRDIARCHQYDTSNVKRQKAGSLTYVCSGCQTQITLGPKRHRREQARPGTYWHRGCRPARLVLAGAAPKPAVKPTPQPRPLLTGQGTKQQQALALYRQYNSERDRKGMIQMFIDVLGMTQAGASTYYYNCQKAA